MTLWKYEFIKGPKATIPTLDEAEPGFAKDTNEFFIGSSSGNVQLAKQSDLDTTNTNKADKTYVDTQTGDLTTLQTTDKSNLVNAVNENVAHLAQMVYLVPKPNGADDTTALQNAINYAHTNNLTAGIPSGTYKVSGSITQNANQRVIGLGNVTIQGTTTGMTIWNINGGTGIGGGSLENVTINGNNVASIGLNYGGSTQCAGFKTESVIVEQCTTAGVQSGDNFWSNTFINCDFAANTISFHHLGGNNAGENISFYNCDFYNSSGKGLVIENPGNGGQSIFCYACSFDYNADWSIQNGTSAVDGCHLSLIACHIESQQKFLLNYGQCNITGSFLTNGTNSGTLGYLLENHGDMTIIGGRFSNSGTGKAIYNYGNLSYLSCVGLDSANTVVNQSGANTNNVFQFGANVNQYTFMSNFLNTGQLNLNGRQVTYGSAIPTTRTWSQGDYIYNFNPTVQGTAGSQYIIRGWACVTGGTPGTWVQDRGYTGT